jgi:predicted DCC family thiol-disulfide oxidoreductase YuxK
VVLIDGGSYVIRSEAVLRIARDLGRPWSLLWPLVHVPRPLRDLVYRLIARSRYRIFGRRDICRVPTPDERDRFL